MFGTLKNTLKKDWYNNKENQIIKMITPKYTLEYQVFSTYHIKTEDYYIQTNFNSDKEFEKFLTTIKNRSTHNYKVNLNKDDYILTLSSCYLENEKIVLHAKQIKKEIRDF